MIYPSFRALDFRLFRRCPARRPRPRPRPPLMLAVTLSRSLAPRRIAIQSARCLASKAPPQKQPANNTPPPPAPQAQSQPSSSVPSLDFSPTIEEEEGPRERTGARSSKNSLSSSERRRRMFARGAMAAFLVGAGVQTWMMGREWEEWELKEKRMVRGTIIVLYGHDS